MASSPFDRFGQSDDGIDSELEQKRAILEYALIQYWEEEVSPRIEIMTRLVALLPPTEPERYRLSVYEHSPAAWIDKYAFRSDYGGWRLQYDRERQSGDVVPLRLPLDGAVRVIDFGCETFHSKVSNQREYWVLCGGGIVIHNREGHLEAGASTGCTFKLVGASVTLAEFEERFAEAIYDASRHRFRKSQY